MVAVVHPGIESALDALDSAVDTLIGLSFDDLTCPELLAVLSRLERAARRVPVAEQTMVARLAREATPAQLGAPVLTQALADVLQISAEDAKRRIGNAAALAPRIGLTGEPLPPLLPETAAVQAKGEVGPEQIKIVQKILKKLPRHTPADVAADAEAQMAANAAQFRPEQLRTLGRRLLDTLNPDGEFDERERNRQRGVVFGPQQPDGLSRISGWVTPQCRATMEPAVHKLGAPGMCNPDDAQPCTSGTPTDAQIQADARSTAQRNHDALQQVFRSALSSGELGQHHGLPVTIIVSTTMQDLESVSGHGVSAGGTLVPMRDIIRWAADAYHYLCIFDQATEKPLNLFRTKRCASDAQRIALHAIHRGCTYPGCTAPAYLTEVHHLNGYANGGNTNVEDMTLACRPHHKLVKPGGWQTVRGAGARRYGYHHRNSTSAKPAPTTTTTPNAFSGKGIGNRRANRGPCQPSPICGTGVSARLG